MLLICTFISTPSGGLLRIHSTIITGNFALKSLYLSTFYISDFLLNILLFYYYFRHTFKSSQAQLWIQDHGCGAEYFVEEFVVDFLTIHDNKFIVDDFTTNFCWRCHNKVVVGILHRRARARDSHDDYHNNFFHNPQQNNSTMTSTKKPMNFYYRNQQQSTTTICCSIVNKISHNEFTTKFTTTYQQPINGLKT